MTGKLTDDTTSCESNTRHNITIHQHNHQSIDRSIDSVYHNSHDVCTVASIPIPSGRSMHSVKKF